MAGKDIILDFSAFDLNNVIAGVEEIRQFNPQRFEMEQLTAIVYEDLEAKIFVGYKDVTDQEFWVRGHMPGMPLMPGVIMCECAAKLCSYSTQKNNLMGVKMIGFGALEEVRFRDVVKPGSRFVVMTQMIKCRPRAMIVSRFQGFVEENLVVEGTIKGIPLPVELMLASQQQ